MKRCLLLLILFLVPVGAFSAAPRKAAEFALPTPDGRTIRLSEQRNKVVVLEFLQTACPRCQETGEMLQKIYTEKAARGLEIIGISHDPAGMPAISKYVEEYKLTYPVVLGDLDVAVSYTGASAEHPSFEVPLFIFIDRNGNVAEKRTLENLDDRDFYLQLPGSIEAVIERLLGPEKKPARRRTSSISRTTPSPRTSDPVF